MKNKRYIVFILFLITILSKNNIYANKISNDIQNILERIDSKNSNKYETDIKLLEKKTKEIPIQKLKKIYKELAVKYSEKEYYNISLFYLIKELNLVNEDIEISEKSELLNRIGTIYFLTNKIDLAEIKFRESYDLLKKIPKDQLNEQNTKVLNNIAFIYSKNGNYDKSTQFLTQYLKYISSTNTEELSKVYQNLFLNYLYLGEKEVAKKYLYKSKRIGETKNHNKELASIYYNLSLLHCEENRNDSADIYLDKMFNISIKNNLKKFIQISSKEKSKRFLNSKNIDSAFHYLKINQEILEEKNINDHNKLIDEYNKIEDLIGIDTKNERTKFINIIVILLITIILIIFLFTVIFYKKRLLETRKKENELNKLLVKKENEVTQKELLLLNKNSLIIESTKKLNEVISKTERETKNELSKIIRELKASEKSYNENEFEIILKENFSDFYKTLIEKYPSLTRNEIRLCLFAKLNLSVKEVSSITKQSSNSIITARHRLKKKLNLSKDESLTKFILKL